MSPSSWWYLQLKHGNKAFKIVAKGVLISENFSSNLQKSCQIMTLFLSICKGHSIRAYLDTYYLNSLTYMERECKKEAGAQMRQKIACQCSLKGFQNLSGLLFLKLINFFKVNVLSVFKEATYRISSNQTIPRLIPAV